MAYVTPSIRLPIAQAITSIPSPSTLTTRSKHAHGTPMPYNRTTRTLRSHWLGFTISRRYHIMHRVPQSPLLPQYLKIASQSSKRWPPIHTSSRKRANGATETDSPVALLPNISNMCVVRSEQPQGPTFDSPAERLHKNMHKRTGLNVCVHLDREDLTHNNWLLQGLGHRYWACFKYLRVPIILRSEAAYVMATFKMALDLKVVNATWSAVKTDLCIRSLRCINITSQTPFAVIKHPINISWSATVRTFIELHRYKSSMRCKPLYERATSNKGQAEHHVHGWVHKGMSPPLRHKLDERVACYQVHRLRCDSPNTSFHQGTETWKLKQEYTWAIIVLPILERIWRRRDVCPIPNMPGFNPIKQHRSGEMHDILQWCISILNFKIIALTLSALNPEAILSKICSILSFEGLTPANYVKEDTSPPIRDRIWFNRTPRMRAPHPIVCFAERQNVDCDRGGSESPPCLNDDNSSSIPNDGNTTLNPETMNPDHDTKDMPDDEHLYLTSSNHIGEAIEVENEDESTSEPEDDIHGKSEIDESEIHTALSFQIPPEILRVAMQASPNSQASFYSYMLYRGPEGQSLSVHYCRNIEVAERVAKYFMDEKILGFDIEWKPWASPNSIKDNLSLIQIASEDRIALFHVSLFAGDTAEELMPPTLKLLLSSPDICKVGVAIKGDFTRLENHLGVKAFGVFEISRLHNLVQYYTMDPRKVNKKLVSLATQTKIHLQLPLFKGDVRESDWTKPLTTDQLRYAATDAYAGLRIFDVLDCKRKMLRPIPPLPAFCDDDLQRRRQPAKISPKSPTATAKLDDCEALEGHESEQDADWHDIDLVTSTSLKAPRTPLQFKSLLLTTIPKSAEYTLAEAWAKSYLFLTIPSVALNSTSTSQPSRIRATVSHMRAYHMWYHQGLSLNEIANHLRDPPLASSTVIGYIAQAVELEKLEFRQEELKMALRGLPFWLKKGRYKHLIDRIGGLD